MKLVDLIELAKRGEDEKLEFKSAPAKSLPEERVCLSQHRRGNCAGGSLRPGGNIRSGKRPESQAENIGPNGISDPGPEDQNKFSQPFAS